MSEERRDPCEGCIEQPYYPNCDPKRCRFNSFEDPYWEEEEEDEPECEYTGELCLGDPYFCEDCPIFHEFLNEEKGGSLE